jgi:hypothetical protein
MHPSRSQIAEWITTADRNWIGALYVITSFVSARAADPTGDCSRAFPRSPTVAFGQTWITLVARCGGATRSVPHRLKRPCGVGSLFGTTATPRQ